LQFVAFKRLFSANSPLLKYMYYNIAGNSASGSFIFLSFAPTTANNQIKVSSFSLKTATAWFEFFDLK